MEQKHSKTEQESSGRRAQDAPTAMTDHLTAASEAENATSYAVGVVQMGDGVVVSVARRGSENNAALRIQELNNFAQSIIESAPISMIATDSAGVIIAMNSAAEKLTLYRKHDLVGQHSLLLLHDSVELSAHAVQLSKDLKQPVAAGFPSLIAKPLLNQPEEREWTYIRKDGSRVWVNLTMTKLHTMDETTTGYLGIAFDVTERKRLADSVTHMAHHDQLTGLPNRTLLRDRLDRGIERAKRFKQKVAIFMIDIDNFKRINDALGHAGGDELLVYLAKQLKSAARATDTVARVGGDEFVVIMPDFRDVEDAQRCADLMLQKIATSVVIRNREVRVRASIGFCLYPDCGEDAPSLLRNADIAMYEAKSVGGGTKQVYSQTLQQETADRLELEEDLRHALENQELTMHYQPQIDCATGQVTGMEALLRWNSPKRGNVPLSSFIPIAEDAGLMIPIGEWAFYQSCCDCVELQNKTGLPLTVAVNLSPRQLSQINLPSLVEKTLAESGLAAKHLEIEITEQMLMVNSPNTLETLQAIRDLGVAIAIDDFGTGFSSFSYILQYRVDRIKIDQSFIANVTKDSNAAAVVRTIIAMAHGLNMRVVAEGVESPEQYDFLLNRHCNDVQGYLFAYPMPKKDFAVAVDRINRAQGKLAQVSDDVDVPKFDVSSSPHACTVH